MNTDPIWQHSQADPNGKLVLLAIAHTANSYGEASLHVRTIMKMTGLSRRGVQRVLRRLEDIGELGSVLGESGSAASLFTISVPKRQKPERADETPAPAGRRVSLAPPVPLSTVRALPNGRAG